MPHTADQTTASPPLPAFQPGLKSGTARTARGETSRGAILETALQLFLARGYEGTTMRAVAERAGVAVGKAYYYFASKEALVQAFYARTHVEHLAASRWILEREPGLEARLQGVMRAKLDTAMPYKALAAALFRIAADPRSPLNPFSADSRPVRDEAVALFAEVLTGSDVRVSGPLGAALPRLLWLYHMGILMFWVHDTSPGCVRSYHLAQRTVEIVVRLIAFAKLPPFRPVVRATLRLLAELGLGGEEVHDAMDPRG